MDESILEKVDCPADLKVLTYQELERLAFEIRKLIIETTSLSGGHLASSLGAVELAIAVHRAYNAPRDKIIWDVGHQAYAHKIITGRREAFRTLRKKGGISGFPRKVESPCDVVDSGHSGSSISYGLGLALARDLAGEDFSIAVVVGDGSMTSGVAYEAMNQAGHHLKSNLVIILNDNEMSISKNVGGIASYLSRLRIKPTYTHFKSQLEAAIKTMPGPGKAVYHMFTSVKEAVTHALVPGVLFEALGLKYVGPIDGHDIKEIEATLREAKDIPGPVLIHALTVKGKGYPPSEEKPDEFHGIGPFDMSCGKPLKTGGLRTYTEVFSDAIVRLGSERKDLVAITAAMKLGTGLDRFSKCFPDRFFDVGIAEQFAVNLAAGLALGGLRPVVAIYSTFLQRAFDQLSQEVCLQKLPVILIVDRAGLVGEDGATHHGYFDVTYLRAMPNMQVLAPADGRELEMMLNYAMDQNGPVAIRFPRSVESTFPSYEPPEIVRGTGVVLKEGKDAVIIALGDMLATACAASEILATEGLDTGVVNARFAKPLSPDFIGNICTGKKLVVTVENNMISGGFGSAVLECLADIGVTVPFLRKGIPDRYVEHGGIVELLEDIRLTPAGIAEEVASRLRGDGLKKT